MNVLDNAIDAVRGEGKIVIKTAWHDPVVEICIRDTGCGIPPELISKIFDPFFSTKGTHGTGLGLAISYGIMKEHGGDIIVESHVGLGTEFKIILPDQKNNENKP
ncbi:MAG: hypothetical protein HYS08_00940 [Chlamydiae bacterium]|nr:hypothetical protein [Chlamydiota bacterium]MBI3265644.1 hypothetical protein [Chlamydiota bacterium]